MSHARKWLLGCAVLLTLAVAVPAEAGLIRFAGRVAVRTPVAAVRTAAAVTPPYYRPYYAPTYTYGRTYVQPYTVARPVIYVR
jgi:hypothetical protein